MTNEKICKMCNGTKKIKDYYVNNHFKQSLKMTWYEIIKCPYCLNKEESNA
jgi:hypothetical protein